MHITLETDDLAELFPAFMCLDQCGAIKEVGPSFRRLCGSKLLGQDFFAIMQFERPATVNSIEELHGLSDEIIIRSKGDIPLRLRGIVRQHADSFVFFLGHIPDVEASMDGMLLKFSDFSPSDGSLDLILAAEMRRNLLEDANSLVSSLKKQKKAAEAANTAKSSFLANMSHEIRTPLNGVLGMASILANTKLENDQKEHLKIITDSGEALLTILSDILNLSKIESGTIDLEHKWFNLNELGGRCLSVFRLDAENRGLNLKLDIEPSALGFYRGDEFRIQQILSNLISNALKFTSEGEVHVRIFQKSCSVKKRVCLVFEVQDTGIGIDGDSLANVFESFTQADSTITRKYGGTGLGLTISKQLCVLMGGDIEAQSEPGVGSTFRFFANLAYKKSGETDSDLKNTKPTQVSDAKKSNLKVLVAEDNEINQIVIREHLRLLTTDVTVVGNGREAVDLWQSEGFDLILMDIRMPIMDGVAAVGEIRQLENDNDLPRTPIIALTANIMDHQINEYLASGIDQCVAKPIYSKTLLKQIASVCAVNTETLISDVA